MNKILLLLFFNFLVSGDIDEKRGSGVRPENPVLNDDSDGNYFEGTCDVLFPLGKNQIKGQIDLLVKDKVHIGKLRVELPTPLNVSLMQSHFRNDSIFFITSSPATGLNVKFDAVTDSIKGALLLGGGRSFPFSGRRTGKQANESVRDAFSRKAMVSPEASGAAFPTIAADGNLVVYSSYGEDFSRQTLMFQVRENNRWSAPEKLPFSGAFSDRAPAFDPDEKYLYFGSTRPYDGKIGSSDYDIWRVRYKKGTWGDPEVLEGVNSPEHDYQPSVTAGGIYFSSHREGGMGGQDIWFAPGKNGKFADPQNLGESVNSKHGEISAFVSEDEVFMLLSSADSEATYGNDDLLLYQKTDGQWTFVRNLGAEINSFANEYGAFVSRDGRWLYYTSDIKPRAKIYRTEWGVYTNRKKE